MFTISLALVAVACRHSPPPASATWLDQGPVDPAALEYLRGQERSASPPMTGGADGSLGFEEIQGLVLERHPGVAQARASLDAAEAMVSHAGAWPNPELEARVLQGSDGERGMEGAVRVPLPLSGRLGAARSAARLEADLQAVSLDGALHGAMLEAERLYLRLCHARAVRALEERLVARSRDNAGLARQRASADLVDPLELSLILAEAAQDERALARTSQEVAATERELLVLAGLEPGTVTIQASPMAAHRLEETIEGLLLDVPSHRHAFIQAGLARDKARWMRIEASRSRVPDLVVGPAMSRDGDAGRIGLAVGLPVPILAPGVAPLRAAEAHERAAAEALLAESRQAAAEIRTLGDRLVAIERQWDAIAGEAREAARVALEVAEQRYRAGHMEPLLLVSAHRAAAGLEKEALHLLLEWGEALLDLEAAVGRPLRVVTLHEEEEE